MGVVANFCAYLLLLKPLDPPLDSYPLFPAKTNLQDHARLCKNLARSCKIVQESCKNLACKTCLARARDMSLFLHDSCTILHQFLQDLAKNVQAIILAATLAKSCTISCKICARLCKNCARNVQEKGHIVCTCQASLACKILARFLHNLAWSCIIGLFLLGCYQNHSLYAHAPLAPLNPINFGLMKYSLDLR